MIGPDGPELTDFPVWAWPYINVARIVKGETRTAVEHGSVVATPAFATATRLGALIAAATVKQIAGHIKDERLRSELSAAANATLNDDGDELCPRRKWPWPHPPRGLELAELAGCVALAAAATGSKVLNHELGQVAEKLSVQSQEQ
jgi:hypothetical protein